MLELQLYNIFVIVVTCVPLNLASGQISYNTTALANGGYPVGTVVSFTCFDTFNKFGVEASTCLVTGLWNDQPPLCAPSGNEMNTLFQF